MERRAGAQANVNEYEKMEEVPRYKFQPSNSGSLITFFKVASLSSTKLQSGEEISFKKQEPTWVPNKIVIKSGFSDDIKIIVSLSCIHTEGSGLDVLVSFEVVSVLLPWA